ncbi:MAG: hypothetical protein AAGJ74_13655 [Pseudomonadota bacterium]
MSEINGPGTGKTSGQDTPLNGAAPKPMSWELRIAEARRHKAEALAKSARVPSDTAPPPPVVAMGEVDTETVPAGSEPPQWMITDAPAPTAPAVDAEPVAPTAAAASKPRRSRWLDRGAAVFTIGVLATLYLTGQFDPAPQIATVTPPAAVAPAPSAPPAEPEAAPTQEVAAVVPQTRPLARPEAAQTGGGTTAAALVFPDSATGSLSDSAVEPEVAATTPAPLAGPATNAADTPSAITTLTAPAAQLAAPEATLEAPAAEDLAALAAPGQSALPAAPETAQPEAALPAAIPPAARPWDTRGGDLATAQDLRIILTTSSAMSANQRAGFQAAIESFGFTISTAQEAGFRISENQVRFFHPEDINAAGALADAVGARVRDFTTFRPAPPPGTLEIYLNAEGLAPLQPASAGEALDRLRDRLAEAIARGDHL